MLVTLKVFNMEGELLGSCRNHVVPDKDDYIWLVHSSEFYKVVKVVYWCAIEQLGSQEVPIVSIIVEAAALKFGKDG